MDPYLGELRIFPYNFVPKGWAACNGQIMQIAQYNALYAVIGTKYGGDGRTTFALPDLQGRTPMHFSSDYVQGAKGGSNNTALSLGNLPVHTHAVQVYSLPNQTQIANPGTPVGNILGLPTDNEFTPKGTNTLVAMANAAVGTTGNSVPVSNMQPYLGLDICMALVGIFPTRG